jgi:hypothetical protein
VFYVSWDNNSMSILYDRIGRDKMYGFLDRSYERCGKNTGDGFNNGIHFNEIWFNKDYKFAKH